jgi:hypothetical protein
MSAQNGVVGDQDLPTNIPASQVPEEALTEEKKMAQYSQSAEFKRLSDFMKNRIKFYQRYLPSGERVEGNAVQVGMPEGVPMGDLAAYWTAACIVIKEFENVLSEYDLAREAVTDARPDDN